MSYSNTYDAARRTSPAIPGLLTIIHIIYNRNWGVKVTTKLVVGCFSCFVYRIEIASIEFSIVTFSSMSIHQS